MQLSVEVMSLYVAGSSPLAPFSLTLSLSSPSVPEGGQLTATCQVTAPPNRTYILIWLKKSAPATSNFPHFATVGGSNEITRPAIDYARIDDVTSDEDYVTAADVTGVVEIATNGYVNSEFRRTGRYEAGYEAINGRAKVKFVLNISGE